MISPQASEKLQAEIDALLARTSDPQLLADIQGVLAEAEATHAAMVAAGMCGSGLVGTQYRALLDKKLL
jgi:hypothetical protein